METLFLIYHESLESDVRAVIERHMVISRYTRIDGVVGARMAERAEETGQPAERRNRVIILVADPDSVVRMLADLNVLREREGHGIRAFAIPTSRVI